MTGTDPRSPRRGGARGWPLWLLAAAAVTAVGAPGAAQVTVPPGAPRSAVGPARGWLGVNVTVIHRAGEGPDRILVEDVWEGSPALEAGLRPGDRILRVNGVPVSGDRFRSLTRRLEPGDPMTLLVVRDSRELEVSLVAGERPEPGVLVPRELQQELDAVRGHLTQILEGARVRVVTDQGGDATLHLLAPSIVVEGIQGDSITTRVVLRADSLASRARVASVSRWAPDSVSGVFDASAPRAGPPVPFSVWLQTTDSVAPAAVHVARRAEEERARRAAEEVVVTLRNRSGASEVTVDARPARPLAPYLAGMNRVAGAEMRAMTPELAPYFGVDRGVLVTRVEAETPAGAAGLRAGDVVLEVNGTPVSSLPELRELLAGFRGRPVLEVLRKGQRVQVQLR